MFSEICLPPFSHYKALSLSSRYTHLKGGYLDFSHLTELKDIYIIEIYMKKQYKSSIIKNHKITKKKSYFDGFP